MIEKIKYPLGDSIGMVSLVDKMQQDTALKVINSAKVSYASKADVFDPKDKKLISYLWENQHTSPFRHTYYTFHLKCPLFVFRQWTKYQVASNWRKYEVDGHPVSLEVFDLFYDDEKGCSWNEISGRYAILKPEFYIPTTIRGNIAHGSKQASTDLPHDFPHEEVKLKLMNICELQYKEYEALLEQGVAKEIARTILPQSIYTEAYWTVSLQSVMHFLMQRLDKNAQFEIRQFAEAVYSLIEDDLTKMGLNKESFL